MEGERAPVKTFRSAVARGPGREATGALGVGDGESEVLVSMILAGDCRLLRRFNAECSVIL